MAKFKVGDVVRIRSLSAVWIVERTATVDTAFHKLRLLFGTPHTKYSELTGVTYAIGQSLTHIKKPLGGEGQDASGGRGMGEEKQPDRTT